MTVSADLEYWSTQCMLVAIAETLSMRARNPDAVPLDLHLGFDIDNIYWEFRGVQERDHEEEERQHLLNQEGLDNDISVLDDIIGCVGLNLQSLTVYFADAWGNADKESWYISWAAFVEKFPATEERLRAMREH